MYIQICSGVRGLFDGISGTWMRQLSYSMCRFWAYDESKKILGAGKDAPAWKLAAAGSMGAYFTSAERLSDGVLI
jgi:dicarboxylate transporter 10